MFVGVLADCERVVTGTYDGIFKIWEGPTRKAPLQVQMMLADDCYTITCWNLAGEQVAEFVAVEPTQKVVDPLVRIHFEIPAPDRRRWQPVFGSKSLEDEDPGESVADICVQRARRSN